MSRAAIADVRELIEAISPIEPDLAAIPEPLDKIRANTFAPDLCTSAWRRLYLSIYVLPCRLLLVGSIDDSPKLAELVDDAPGLLIVETDSQRVSTAKLLDSRNAVAFFIRVWRRPRSGGPDPTGDGAGTQSSAHWFAGLGELCRVGDDGSVRCRAAN